VTPSASSHPRRARAILALEDGAFFRGLSFGRQGETEGEVVFNTGLCGYQEVLTDPSYSGQIVTMTYPHIGNYGVNPEDVESSRPQIAGFVVRELSAVASSWRSNGDLGRYLDDAAVVGISEIDTRALTRHLRIHGAKRGVISALSEDPDELVDRAATARGGYHVVAYDFGMKRNILRMLAALGCDVTVVPATTAAEEALRLQPDGIFLSNGPGDPEPCGYAIEAARALMQVRPTFGICLGHQIMGLACGGKTFKLKFGHRGANHPVKNLDSGQVAITSQNHGFAVEPSLFDDPRYELTHRNLNDGTVEGFRHRDLLAFSVQYHPEASPGPHDSHGLFKEFLTLMSGTLAHVPAGT